jgi:arylsulfatase A-like enzyme
MKPILTLLTALLLALLAPLHAADSRPNIVFLFTDDQTIGTLGCYGNKEIITPHMNKLAADGVRFRNHYNSTSICMANHVRLYYALISGVDSAVGMIRAELESQGLAENTVIILTSDNGYNSCSHGFGDKVLPYEEGSKSPLIIFDPRLPKSHAGQVSNSVTANVDMTATIFALANVAVPSAIDGKNVIPLLSNPNNKVRDWLPLFNHWGAASSQSMAVVSPEWKYVHWYYAGQLKPEDTAVEPTEVLFHLPVDRTEMTNVASEARFASQLATAREAYDAELAAMKTKLISGHGYEAYTVLFDRATSWDSKVPLLIRIVGKDASEGGRGEQKSDDKKKAKKE